MFAIFSLLVCFAAVLPINILAAPPGPRLNLKRYLTSAQIAEAGPSGSEPPPSYSAVSRVPSENSLLRWSTSVLPSEFLPPPEDEERSRGNIPDKDVEVGDIISVSELPGAPLKDPGQTSWRLIVASVDTTDDGTIPGACFIFKRVKKQKVLGFSLGEGKLPAGWKRDKDLFPKPRRSDIFPGCSVDVFLGRVWTVRHAKLVNGRAKKSAIPAIMEEISRFGGNLQAPPYSSPMVDPPAYDAVYPQSTNQGSSAVHPRSPLK